jgi:hypothetical protein
MATEAATTTSRFIWLPPLFDALSQVCMLNLPPVVNRDQLSYTSVWSVFRASPTQRWATEVERGFCSDEGAGAKGTARRLSASPDR